MSVFEFISVALSFVIGLGIARLLTAIVALFRARKRVQLHWMPFVWAAAAAALLLPVRPGADAADLLEDFEQNGKWGLVVLVAYFAVAVTANSALFGLPLAAPLNLLTASLTIFPLIVLVAKQTRVQSAATLLNIPLSLYAFARFSPDIY